MADNSSMLNVSMVESYGKNLQKVNGQMMEVFGQLQKQTSQLGLYWKDDQYDRFLQDYNNDIMKSIQEINSKMAIFQKYVAEMVQLHRMAQQKKYY